MRLRYFAAAVLLAAAGWNFGSEIAEFPYLKTLIRQTGEGRFGSVRLDSELMLHEESGMKIFAPDGSEVVMGKIRPVMKRIKEQVLTPVELKVSLADKDGFTPGFLLENPGKVEIAGFSIQTAEHNFDKLLRIEGSDDGKTFRTIVGRTAFYDYSGRFDLARTEFTFPPARDAHFRVWVMDYPLGEPLPALEFDGGVYPKGTDEAQLRRRLGINRISALQLVEVEREIEVLEAVIPRETARSEEERRTSVEFSADLVRVDRVELSAGGEKPYLRSAGVYGSHDKERYVFLGGIEICRLFETVPERRLIRFDDFPGGVRYPHYRLVIQNGELAPLPELNLSLYGVAREIIFESESPTLALVYGGKSLPPRPALAADNDGVSYQPGPEQPNPGFAQSKTNYLRWGLAFAVSVLLITLFTLLWRGFRMIRAENS